MLSVYLYLLFFFVVSVLMPASMFLFSRLVRPRTIEHPTRLRNYESAEEPIGERVTIMTEYIYYFAMFLAFEIIIAVAVFWVLAAKQLPLIVNIKAIGLIVFGFVLEAFVILIARARWE